MLGVGGASAETLKERYLRALDRWVAEGGKEAEIQESVIRTCGKLVMVTASAGERLGFVTTQRKEWAYRVDVCAKMTANRVHPQPEFEKVKFVKMICDDSKVQLFRELCVRAGLRK